MKSSGNLVSKKNGVCLMTGFGKWHVAWVGGYRRFDSFSEARILYREKVREAA